MAHMREMQLHLASHLHSRHSPPGGYGRGGQAPCQPPYGDESACEFADESALRSARHLGYASARPGRHAGGSLQPRARHVKTGTPGCQNRYLNRRLRAYEPLTEPIANTFLAVTRKGSLRSQVNYIY
jgi:hypothetical protein